MNNSVEPIISDSNNVGTLTKICFRCKSRQPAAEFFKSSRTPDGLHSWCKQCLRKRNAERKATDPEYCKSLQAAYEKYSHTPKALAKSRRNHTKNKLKELQQGKKYYRENKQKRLGNHSKWIKTNRKRAREYANNYCKKRLANDPIFAFATRIRRLLRVTLTNESIKKSKRTFDYLGYNKNELANHLNQWLNKPCEVCKLTNITMKNSHIDHIVPISTARSETEVVQLNQLTNLRLICPTCNIKKGNKQ